MKVKEVVIAERKFNIASLTVDQYEQFIGDGVSSTGKEVVRNHMVPLVAAGLRNAKEGNGRWFPKWDGVQAETEEPSITPQLVSADLDFAELNELYAAIVELSGLKTASQPTGEARAATIQ